jgi:serine/threonine protein kinase
MAMPTDADPGDGCEKNSETVSHADALRLFLRGHVVPDPLSSTDGERILRGAAVRNPEVGDRFGQFTLTRFLGKGSFGSVFEAEQDAPVRRHVAVKVLTGAERSAQAERRFDAERRALASLSHAGIAAILDGGVAGDGTPWFAMELVDGQPVDAFAEHAKLAAAARVALVCQACQAVEFAHRRGVLHRDLKPGNVLVQGGAGAPRVKVIDFGLAKVAAGEGADPHVAETTPASVAGGDAGSGALPADATRAGQVLGTPAYMSPEAASMEPWRIDARSDVFSLAAIAVRLLTGGPPHAPREGETDSAQLARVRAGEVGSFAGRLRTAGVPRARDLDAVLRRGLATDPIDRYQTAAEFEQDLERWTNGFPVHARPLRAPGRTWRLVRRHPVASLVVGVLAVGMAVSAALAIRQARVAEERQREAETRVVRMRESIEPLLVSVQLSKLAGESLEAQSRLVAAYAEVFGPEDSRTNTRRLQLALAMRGARRFDEALAQYGALLDIAVRHGYGIETKGAQRILGDMADTLRMKGDVAAARALCEECVLFADTLNDGCDGNFQQARLALTCLLMEAGECDRALAEAQCAVDALARCQPDAAGQRVIAESLLADALCAVGRDAEGRAIIAGLRARAPELVARIATLKGVAREWEAQAVLERAEELAKTDPGGAAMMREAEAEALERELRRAPGVVHRLRWRRDFGGNN